MSTEAVISFWDELAQLREARTGVYGALCAELEKIANAGVAVARKLAPSSAVAQEALSMFPSSPFAQALQNAAKRKAGTQARAAAAPAAAKALTVQHPIAGVAANPAAVAAARATNLPPARTLATGGYRALHQGATERMVSTLKAQQAKARPVVQAAKAPVPAQAQVVAPPLPQRVLDKLYSRFRQPLGGLVKTQSQFTEIEQAAFRQELLRIAQS